MVVVTRNSTVAPRPKALGVVPSSPRVTVKSEPTRAVQVHISTVNPSGLSSVTRNTSFPVGVGNSEPSDTGNTVSTAVIEEVSVVFALFANNQLIVHIPPGIQFPDRFP